MYRNLHYLKVPAAAVTALAFIFTPALSQDASTTAALGIIKDAADSICGTVRQDGSKTETDANGKLSVDANLNLGGVLKNVIGKLIAGGVSTSGTITNENYQNVVRDQLASVISHNEDCRLEVFQVLASRLLFKEVVADRVCPQKPGPSITVEHSLLQDNGTVFGVAPGVNVCVIDSTLKGNKNVFDVK
jgi:hypothetical protein